MCEKKKAARRGWLSALVSAAAPGPQSCVSTSQRSCTCRRIRSSKHWNLCILQPSSPLGFEVPGDTLGCAGRDLHIKCPKPKRGPMHLLRKPMCQLLNVCRIPGPTFTCVWLPENADLPRLQLSIAPTFLGALNRQILEAACLEPAAAWDCRVGSVQHRVSRQGQTPWVQSRLWAPC